ncbi:flagellar hook-length control protein FliK [Luteibacter sp. UNCMF366Tsu5.1]|uniref:flagellar hook-length control protein FliK n=1 Tax=Luteibacter sp. UNCMF366Tsu5.1 TaxID=1502758 RepID=UPI000908EBFA|nr:flagellar hook-length control protein FliK [Luteibacter sp. UNCMF366Tsu5.1]SFW37156.1 flagellar hook-length control protein FliK [Luteibacter sp. UNCMF366Tsu5.1]
MNNATLALNIARPPAPAAAATPTAAGREQEGGASTKRFDAALDAAHADAHAPRDQARDAQDTKTAPAAPAQAAANAKADKEPDAKPSDKEASAVDDPSIAATMLSLIGVPAKAVDVAAAALGVTKQAGAALGMPGAAAPLAGALAAGGDAAGAVVPDATAALLDKTTLPAAGVAGAAAGVVPPSFAALLATQGGAAASKDDNGPVVDAANSPMPLMHTPDLGNAAPVMQVQATQAATTPQFAQELGEQIAWMGSGQIKEARIKLHPEELGSMDVRVHLDAGKVNVAILAQHPAAVHAVQQTLSQLDSMLAHHGLSLGQADVGQRQGGEAADGRSDGSQGQGAEPGASGAAETVAVSSVSRSLLDEIA